MWRFLTKRPPFSYRFHHSSHSKNEISELPDNFKAWVETNRERIERAEERGTLPYFIKDNKTIIFKVAPEEDLSSVVKKFFKGLGINIRQDDVSLKDGFVEISNHLYCQYANIIAPKGSELERLTCGKDGYFASMHSWAINEALRRDPSVLNVAEKKLIDILDKTINSHKFPFPIKVIRCCDFSEINSMFGGKIQINEDPKEILKQIDALKDKTTTPNRGFLSTSYDPNKNMFKDKSYRLYIEIPANTPLFVAPNSEESEILLGRGLKLEFKSSYLGKNSYEYDAGFIICRAVGY